MKRQRISRDFPLSFLSSSLHLLKSEFTKHFRHSFKIIAAINASIFYSNEVMEQEMESERRKSEGRIAMMLNCVSLVLDEVFLPTFQVHNQCPEMHHPNSLVNTLTAIAAVAALLTIFC
jgi:hypothetical protein